MPLNPDIRDQAYQFFIEEAQELLQVLETGLLDLRQDHSTPKVHELMRAAHSIKGGAASVELGAIELLAHRLEDFFKALYSDEIDFDGELEGLLLQGYDCLANPLTEQIEEGNFDEEVALLTAEPVFAALEVRLEDALKNADNYIPSSNDLGVDIVSSIFEVDVVQALEHLQEVAANPSNYDLEEELQNQLDMFAGFAELFNLSGFSDIIQTSQTALEQNPRRVLDIIQATVADCTIAKDLVLAGDRDQGGEVSSKLKELAQPTELSSAMDTTTKIDESLADESSLWSTSALADSLTEDIFAEPIALADSGIDDVFGSIPDDSITESEVTVQSNQALDDSVDDVFGTIPNNESAEDIFAEPIALADSGVDDVFGSIPDDSLVTEAADNSLDNVFGTIPDNESEENIFAEPVALADSGIDDVFGSIPDDSITESEAVVQNSQAADNNLDDVFGTIPGNELEENIFAEPVVLADSGIDDVFGSVDDDSITESEAVVQNSQAADNNLDDVFGTIPGNELEENIFAEPVVLADSGIDDVFGSVDDDSLVTEAADNSLDGVFEVIPESSDLETDKELVEENPSQPENREAAVESIEAIFQDLPSLETLPASLALPTKATSKPKSASKSEKTSKTKQKATPKLSVRVDLDRLERMNNLVGELTINRNSLSLQNQQLQENVSELGQKFLRFRELTKKLSEVSDKIVLEQRSNGLRSSIARSSLVHQSAYSTEFDSLEMDSYGSLYSSLQEVLEEIVQLEESVDDITIFAKQSDRTINDQRQMLSQMRDELMWVRMLPLDQILQRFPRTLRDLSSKHHKPVNLKLIGTGVLVDKAVLEKLSDPLLHLLRNGFDHGIEAPEVRMREGKPIDGLIEIHAYYQGNQTVIEVKDDGKGLDLAKISQKAIEQGLISPQEAAIATPERLFDLIFEPGFSTASKVSEISGRGVGMNIVRSQIETLKGKITVASTPGKGSTFSLRLPLTLTIAKLLVCSLGSTAFAIPSDSIEEIIIPINKQIKTANGQKFLSLHTKLIPVYSLREALEYNCPVIDSDSNTKAFKTITAPEDWLAPLLLLRRGQQLFALEVASLLSEQELVIKPYGKAIAAPPYTYGCTILGDGSLIPAFDGAALISTILGEEIDTAIATPSFPPQIDESVLESVTTEESVSDNSIQAITANQKVTSLKTIMIVDDSTALRRTMALTLEKQGYRVIQKKDGKDGLDGFRNNPDLDLIICDVEMPTMNGFEFLGMRRRDSALFKIPTFMLTSRSGEKHRNLAMQLGANGYFTKPYVEQEFVAEIKKILDGKKSITSPNSNSAAIATHTILVIDDSSALRRTLALSLEQKGYRVLQARDGVEGLELLRKNLQTSLVICDVEMPNMNGFEFLTSRRQESKLAQIPVFMLSSRSGEKHQSLATSLGASRYFTKPYVEDKFLPEIEKFIKQSKIAGRK